MFLSVLVLKTNFGHSESFEDKLKLYTVLEPDDRRKGGLGEGSIKNQRHNFINTF